MESNKESIPANINLKKIDKLIYLSYLNSVRIHKASLEIFKNNNYGLSYFLSTISLEELGKAFLLSNFLFDSRFNGRYNYIIDEQLAKEFGTMDFEEYQLRRIFSNHLIKQKEFVISGHSDFFSSLIQKRGLKKRKISKIVQDALSGKLEITKQNSLYVGLPKDGKRINKNAKIIDPLKWPKEKAEYILMRVHNEIISTSIRMYIEKSYLESTYIENFLSKSYIRKLLQPISYINKYNKKLLKIGNII